MSKRTFVEHIALLCTFAEKVDALTPDAWVRLRERCTELAGTTPIAVWRRTELVADASFAFLPDIKDAPFIIRAIPAVTYAGIFGMWMAYDLVSSALPSLDDKPWTRRTNSDRVEFDQFSDAQNAIDHALERHGMRIPSVRTAVRAVIQAVSKHDFYRPGEFERIYAWIEPEIPYALIDPLADASPS